MMTLETPNKQLLIWEERIEQQLPKALGPNQTQLEQAMHYACMNGGKRIRAKLVYASGAALGIDEVLLNPFACAVEIIHAFSLIHDDLPAMDDDAMRRGKPSCHIAYGEAMAILAGDALQAKAFECLSAPCERLMPNQQLQLIQLLSQAAGNMGMTGGQALDMSEDKTHDLATLEQMHQGKTGTLLEAAICGPLIFGPTPKKYTDNLQTFAEHFGLAFQIRDDIIDVEQSSESLGKTAGKDLEQNKLTYPSLLGLDKAKAYLNTKLDDAEQALCGLPQSHTLKAILQSLRLLPETP